MKYKLINIGRNKVNREVDVPNEDDLYGEVGKHLMSRNIDLMTQDDGKTFKVYAGFREVGTVERIDQ